MQNTRRRSYTELLLSHTDREQLLMNEWEIPRREIVAAITSTVKSKTQRSTTVTNLNNLPKLQEAIESAGRKCKRALFFQKRHHHSIIPSPGQPDSREVTRKFEKLATTHGKGMTSSGWDTTKRQRLSRIPVGQGLSITAMR